MLRHPRNVTPLFSSEASNGYKRQRTGGVWLDPGELERIIAWVQGESDASRRARDADAAEYGFADGEVGRRRPRQRELHWRARLVDDFDD